MEKAAEGQYDLWSNLMSLIREEREEKSPWDSSGPNHFRIVFLVKFLAAIGEANWSVRLRPMPAALGRDTAEMHRTFQVLDISDRNKDGR